MDFVTIDILNIEQQSLSVQDFITLSMTPIINISFNKYTISWELIYRHIFHPHDSVMKAMLCYQTLTGLPKHYPKKLNQAPCTICYTGNMTNFSKGTTVDTTNLWPGEIIHIYFSFWNVTSIRGFTSMITVVCSNNRMIFIFSTAYKRTPVCIVRFILTTLNNESQPYNRVRVDKYGALENSTYVTNLLVS